MSSTLASGPEAANKGVTSTDKILIQGQYTSCHDLPIIGLFACVCFLITWLSCVKNLIVNLLM